MAQSFIAVATESAIIGSSGAPWADRLLKRLEDRLGKPLTLYFFVEDSFAEEVFRVHLPEIDVIEFIDVWWQSPELPRNGGSRNP